MSDPYPTQGGTQRSELGALLAGTVRAVVDAQDVLDDHARQLAQEYAAAEPGTLVLPPLWYAFDSVGIDIDLSTEVVRTVVTAGEAPQTQLLVRTLNPVTAGVVRLLGLNGNPRPPDLDTAARRTDGAARFRGSTEMTAPISDSPVLRPEVIAASLPNFKPVATDEIVTIGDRTGHLHAAHGEGERQHRQPQQDRGGAAERAGGGALQQRRAAGEGR